MAEKKSSALKSKNKDKEATPTEKKVSQENSLSFDTVDVSEEVLLATPGRVLRFFTAFNRSAEIRSLLEPRGFSPAVSRRGWELLTAVAGQDTNAGASEESVLDEEVAAAQNSLNAIDEDFFGTISFSLKHAYPRFHASLLKGVAPVDNATAWRGVEIVLDRLDALEKSAEKDAKAVLARLAERQLTTKRRQQLRTLVETAKGTLRPVGPSPEERSQRAENAATERAEQLRALRALRAWYEEWSGIARLAVKRRDLLARLGLATYKEKKPQKVTKDENS